MLRRRLSDGEIGVQVDNSDHMQLLAEMLEIQADGGESAGDFVAYTIKRFNNEIIARSLEKRVEQLREKIYD